MVNLLEDALATTCSMQAITLAGVTKVQLNRLQCKHMVEEFVEVSRVLQQMQTVNIQQPSDATLKEFLRVVKRADVVLQDCCCGDKWLQAAVKHADSRRLSATIHSTLQQCIALFAKESKILTGLKYELMEALLDVEEKSFDRARGEEAEKDEELLHSKVVKRKERLKQNVFSPRHSSKDKFWHWKTQKTVGEDVASNGDELFLAEYMLDKLGMNTNLDQRVLNTRLPRSLVTTDAHDKIEEHLGQGASGTVCRVNWCGIRCAKKVFKTGTEKVFLEEAGILARLSHPNIVKFIICSQEQTSADSAIIMECMPMNLWTFIQERAKTRSEGPFTILAAIDIMLQIASGMEYLHSNGVVHRDLKSSNVLVDPCTAPEFCDDGYADVKLADFGLAKTKILSSSSMTLTTPNAGTTLWRAPEVFAANGSTTYCPRKADVYSFGILCSEILTGKLPFQDGERSKLHERISKKNERPALPSSCPDFVVAHILKCWDSNPKKRPSFQEICKTFKGFSSHLLVPTSFPTEQASSSLLLVPTSFPTDQASSRCDGELWWRLLISSVLYIPNFFVSEQASPSANVQEWKVDWIVLRSFLSDINPIFSPPSIPHVLSVFVICCFVLVSIFLYRKSHLSIFISEISFCFYSGFAFLFGDVWVHCFGFNIYLNFILLLYFAFIALSFCSFEVLGFCTYIFIWLVIWSPKVPYFITYSDREQ